MIMSYFEVQAKARAQTVKEVLQKKNPICEEKKD
jgi:hypothetical protein